jgi:glycosyltransferase involved in cell wall biosynthesis
MRYLDRNEFGVHVACTVGDGTSKPTSLGLIEQIPGIALRPTQFAPGFRGRSRRELFRNLGSAAAFPLDFAALSRYVAREQISIIHGTDRPRDATYAVALGKLTGAKSIVHVHVKWSDGYSAPAKWAVRKADAAFAISRYVAGTIIDMGKPRNDVYTVLNAIDPTRWDPETDGSSVRREFGISSDAPLLASVSRLFSWKGQRELVRALPRVASKVPNVRLLIVGADERHVHGGSFTAELESLALELGVRERITFTGLRSDVPAVMAACDVFTLPSFEEPFGLVFLEAMAMRRPVVAIANGGTPEVVEHEKSGLLSPPWNVQALADNIVNLLQNPGRRREMGAHGRARVLEYFNAARMARDAGDAYRAILCR